MPITISINSGKDFEPVSEGLHVLVLADIVDLGPEQTQYGVKDKVRFVYMTDEADEDGRTKLIFEKFTKSLHEKALLRARLKDLLGRDLTADELKAEQFDIDVLIGAQRQAIVEHNEGKEGKVYANVKAFMKGTPKVKLAIPNDFTRDKDKAPDKRKGKYTTGGGTAAAKAILKPATTNAHGVAVTDEDIPF